MKGVMAEKTRLGGNIVLEGFEELTMAESVVAKKIIGGYARRFSDELEEYKEFQITLNEDESISLILKYGEEEVTVEEKTDNIFFTLGDALKKLEKKVLK